MSDHQLDRITIRAERPSDYESIGLLLDQAFAGHDETLLVERIRETPQYINELTLVAARGQEIVGFSLLSLVQLVGENGSFSMLSLGPVAVLPDSQKQGIGGKLIIEGVNLSQQREEPVIVVLGNPQYYCRFGFQTASIQGIYPPVDWPDESYMVRRLTRYTAQMTGIIAYPPTWQIGADAHG